MARCRTADRTLIRHPRLPDWENRLSATIVQWRRRKFRWDRDCARFAAACAIAVTGEDPLTDLRGAYRSKTAAMKILAGKSMAEHLDERFLRGAPSLARRGDIALMDDNCLGVVLGGEAMFLDPSEGTVMIPRAEWQGVWSVGI